MRNVNFYEIILILDQWFRRCCFKNCSHLELWQPSCSLEPNYLGSFGRGHYTLSKISNWSPYIFQLFLKVRFGYTKFMLI